MTPPSGVHMISLSDYLQNEDEGILFLGFSMEEELLDIRFCEDSGKYACGNRTIDQMRYA